MTMSWFMFRSQHVKKKKTTFFEWPTGCMYIQTAWEHQRAFTAVAVLKPTPPWCLLGAVQKQAMTIPSLQNTQGRLKNKQKKQTDQNRTNVKLTNALTAEVTSLAEVCWNLGIRLKSIFLMCVPIQVRATQFYKSFPPATSPAGSNISNWQEINWPTTWPIYTHRHSSTHARMHAHTLLLIANINSKRLAWG